MKRVDRAFVLSPLLNRISLEENRYPHGLLQLSVPEIG